MTQADRTKTVLRSLAVGPYPVALAVDAPAARLFVVNNYADCHAQSPVWAWVPAAMGFWLPFLRQGPLRSRPACAPFDNGTVLDLARL
jgi:hypothetical protein